MTKVILCGYRDWANRIFENVNLHSKVFVVDTIRSHEEYIQKVDFFPEDIDLILFIGWSWIIPKETTEKFKCLGIHPSNLPFFRGGSPLQHQIINGVQESKVSLMTLSSTKLDAGEIWLQEDLDLSGKNMTEVFKNITSSSIKMLNLFFDNYVDIVPKEQDTTLGSYFKRRTEVQSKITLEQLQQMNLKEIYDFIRCLTDPYPNAYLEDSKGNKLFFQEVSYVPRGN
ncbi:formyltransferase family protein [Pedobacter sp. ASV28]|uniref:formyltransferase family protein n=1 Tax=Pedobacter sp. ASV28 TaxID=2795123 RepID=UPI0018ED713E|nr:formyltransferase family protein [Pedobacter sp. ASV28]